jgi:Alternative complex III, ActD subunit
MPEKRSLLASFEYLDSTVDAIRALRKAGVGEITAYMPYPEHHIEEALGWGQSPVRVWTLVGGLTGAATGFAFTIFTSMDWPLVTGGKPILSMPAYVVIAFELTILFGALSTVIGLFINSRLPYVKPMVVYDPEFSSGRFGLYVSTSDERFAEARRIIERSEPAEIQEDPEEAPRAS